MNWKPDFKPCLRRLESAPISEDGATSAALYDPSGLSTAMIKLSVAALRVVAMMDGQRTCAEIRDTVNDNYQNLLSTDSLSFLIDQLEQAHFLTGPGFESYYDARLEEYRASPARKPTTASALGIVDESGSIFEDMLTDVTVPDLGGTIVGLVAPHLDYPRGRPCYAAAYSTLRQQPAPQRVVVLGTNHFGRATSVVGTASNFNTPLGTTETDVRFLEALETECGSLRKHELDHASEHSVELQVAWLQHIFGAESFQLVAFLCPDPCGPTGTAPYDGEGVDLALFARGLGKLLAEDGRETLLVAGADLSHVGAAFGDDRVLDEAYLEEIRALDQRALGFVESNSPELWIKCVAEGNNPSNICSAGCIYTLATALRGAPGKVLRYHQSVDHASQTCVTCAALVFI